MEQCRVMMRALSLSKKPADRERLAEAKELVHRGHYAAALAVALNVPQAGVAVRSPSLDGPAHDPYGTMAELDPYVPA
jgi:hypothetical protein